MASTTKAPGTIAAAAWTAPDNAKADDETFASWGYTLTNGQVSSPSFIAKNFGFNIPDGATIDGIAATVHFKSSHHEAQKYFWDGEPAIHDGTNYHYGSSAEAWGRGVDVHWETTEGSVTFGSATQKWSYTPTPALVNSADFGFAFGFGMTNLTETPTLMTGYIEYVELTVYYTALGYQHKALGCLPTAIAKIMGIPTANISKFNGV